MRGSRLATTIVLRGLLTKPGMANHRLRVLADFIGPKKIMWATDYPHPDGFFPGAPDMVRARLKGTSSATQQLVLAGGALAFYGMN